MKHLEQPRDTNQYTNADKLVENSSEYSSNAMDRTHKLLQSKVSQKPVPNNALFLYSQANLINLNLCALGNVRIKL